MTPAPAPPDGWFPIRAFWQEGRVMLDWCWLGERRFTDPFFEQTIHAALAHPFSLLFRRQSSLEELAAWAGSQPVPLPAGFIFHMSRCGSTLVSQMLAAAPENIVLSEAGPIDFVLRAQPPGGMLPEEQRLDWLRAVVAALGRRRSPRERHCFIKFDAWHILALPLIRRAFPGVPWIFLYRDPVEVLVSHRREPGGQTVPGVLDPRLFGLGPGEAMQIPPDEYAARVMGCLLRAALDHAGDAHGRLVNYSELPGVMAPELLEFFGMSFGPESLARIQAAAARNAKAPAFAFEPDSARKQCEADARLRDLAARWMQPAHDRLESIRRRRHPR